MKINLLILCSAFLAVSACAWWQPNIYDQDVTTNVDLHVFGLFDLVASTNMVVETATNSGVKVWTISTIAGVGGTNGADGAAGADGTNGLNGASGTNIVNESGFAGPTNKWTIGNDVQFLVISTNGAVTNVYAPSPYNWGTLWVSNSAATTNTFFVNAAAGGYPGIWPSNIIWIPPGKMLCLSVFVSTNKFTNYIYAPR